MNHKPIKHEKRHHIEEISFQPTTSTYKLSIKILVDDVEAHKLPIIMPGATICWERMLACNATETSRVTIRVYKHQYGLHPCIGSVSYLVSSAVNNITESFEYKGKSTIVNIKLPSPEEVGQAPARALAEAQSAVMDPGLLEKMGKVRIAFKTVLEVGTVLAELHPASKAVFGICIKAMEKLEAQEQCDESIESLAIGLSRMLPYINTVKKMAELDQLRKTMTEMLHLIEDASKFILHYKSDGAAVRALRTLVSSTAQDQVNKLLEDFKLLKEEFDRGVDVQTLESVNINNQRALLRELKSVGRARYDPTRSCLPGTRTELIDEIIDWCQPSDTSERLLWIYGQAGLGKSSIAASVCQKLDEQKLLAASFFCKRDDAERRDAERVLATIINGLAVRYPAYLRAVSRAIEEDPQLCSSPMQIQYEKLIQDLLQETLPDACTSSIIVIDALDECGDKVTRRQLFTHLRNISQLTPWLKIVFTSRPDKDIQEYFDRSETVIFSTRNVHSYDAHKDIHTFINERLKDAHVLPTEAGDILTKGASGVFIWAQTACEFILNSLDPKGRYDLIVERTSAVQGPRSLDTLYTTAIESSLGDGGDDNSKIIKQYLGFIIVCSTRTPLSFLTLSQLVGNQATQGILKSVVESLGSVLYTDPNQDDAIRVYHPSFADYLVEHERSGRFCVDVSQANAQMARYCLQAMKTKLKFNICGLETSYRRNKSVPGLEARIKSTIPPYLKYSCLHWTSHLIEAAANNGLDALVEEFVSESRMLYWVEVLSLVDRLYVAVSSTLQLVKWCKSSVSEATWIAKYIVDMDRFLRKFYKPISESAPHLYVSALAFSPAEAELVRVSQAKFRNILSISRGEEKTWSNWQQYILQLAAVMSVTFSPDGKRIVSGSDDNTVRVWDADIGTAVGDPLVGHSDSVMSIGYSPDGKHIVSGSHDKTVRVWDADTGTAVGDPLAGHSSWVTSIGYSPDGKRIVSGSDDKTVRVWDADTGTAVGDPLVGHSSSVWSVGYSPDGKRIVSGSDDKTVRVWDADTGSAVGDPLVGHSDSVWSVGYSPDGKRIVSGSQDKTVRVWDADTGSAVGDPLVGHSSSVWSVGYSPDGKRIVSGSQDNTVRVWDAETGSAVGDPLVGHSRWVTSVEYSPDGKRIVSGSQDKTVRVWDADTGSAVGNPLVGHSFWVTSVGYSPDGKRIVSGSDDNTVRVWDADTGVAVGDPLVGHSRWVTSVEYSPDGKRIVSGSQDNTVQVWDADTGTAVGDPLVGHSDSVWSVGYSPDGKRIVSGSQDKTVQVWDADTGSAVGDPLVGHSSSVWSVGYSPDGKRIVSGSQDKTVRVWDADTGSAVGDPLVGHSDWVMSVGYSPDGKRIVSGSRDNTVRVWDADTGTAVSDPLVGHSSSVTSVRYSPNGNRIVSSSDDKTVRVWDADTGTVVGDPLVGHSSSVTSVGYSPDGKRIVSGSSDKTVRVWHAETLFSAWPLNTSRIDQYCDPDGWVSMDGENLLFWLPEEYRRSELDDSLFVISSSHLLRPIWLDYSKFAYGIEWASVAAN